jgi:hypothetical protein
MYSFIHSFKTRPTRSWNRTGLKKKQRKKNPVWPGQKQLQPVDFCFFILKWCRFDLKEKPGMTRQDTVKNSYNLLTFVFFLLKRCHFDLKINKLTRATRSKPGILALDWAESKSYGFITNVRVLWKTLDRKYKVEDGGIKTIPSL